MKPNPEYTQAPYELAMVDINGAKVCSEFILMRFSESDLPEAMKALAKNDTETLKRLAIAPWIAE